MNGNQKRGRLQRHAQGVDVGVNIGMMRKFIVKKKDTECVILEYIVFGMV